jgi:hypothetical protein
LRVWAAVGLALALAACAPAPKLPSGPIPAGPSIRVVAQPVGQFEPGRAPVPACAGDCGTWTWAGALDLTSPDTSRLHGLSDLKLIGERLTAVSDEGDLLEARLVLDARGAPAGLADARLTSLTDLDGHPISGHKLEADSEGLAILANGDRLVSFERDHRIWLYPAKGGLPRPAPSPPANFPPNAGMEALASDPARGPDAYVVGGEDDGRTWLCRLSKGCQEAGQVPLPKDFALTAVTRLSGGRTAWLLRAFDVTHGARAEILVTDAAMREIDHLRLERPATVDNMEGIAAVEAPGKPVRFYLIADDNFSKAERTLFLAYDWTPPKGTKP